MSTFLSIKKSLQSSFKAFALMSLILSVPSIIVAQCPESLGCNDDIQISLDYQCFAVITPELVLEDERTGCDYMVTIMTANDVIIDQTTYDMGGNPEHPVIDGAFIGDKYKASVSFVDDNNTVISCWGWFSVEDKLPPEVTCIDDITVDCHRDLSELYTSMGMVTYCSETSPADMDGDPSTITIELNMVDGSNTTQPWELIDYIDVSVPMVPYSGSGTGTIITDGGSYMFDEDPVDDDIYRGEISGVQATESNISPTISLVIEDTPANQASIAQGVCVDIQTVSFYKFQQFDNCDPDVEVIINRDEIESLDCTIGDFTARRDIEYYTKDNVGLSADLCAFSIFFEKSSFSEVEFPGNVFFDCDDPLINDNGELNLDPEVTGQPNIDGYPLIDDNNLCRINVTFSDDTFSLCGINTVKILRRWTALDWCEGEYAQSYQTIKVVDEIAPDIECPDDGLRFYADNDCEGDVIFRPFDEDDVTGLKSVFDCANLEAEVYYLRSDDINHLLIDQVYTKAVEISPNVFRASNLQNGINYIRYVITDDCGNESVCEFEIIVEDENPPYAICDQYTAISLADNGWGRLYAAAVDDGSYDECGGPVTLELRRNHSVCDDLPEYENNDLEYGEYVQFCCQEAGLTIPVTMRVTDQGGKTNTCIVSVIVQDKTGVDAVCPPQLVYYLECEDLMAIDTSVTGAPEITGDCGTGLLRYEDSGSINDICGDGNIIRRWYVDLPDRTIELDDCEQIFYFDSDVKLDGNSFSWPQDRDDATCENYLTDLGDAPLYQGVPANEAPICAHLSYSYKDRVFENVEGYCLKIIRTWTVINFCVYDANTNPYNGIWSRTQVIKVSNSEGPELTNCPQDTMINAASNLCGQIINYSPPQAFDNCLQEFQHPQQLRYEIRRNGFLVDSGNGPIVNDTLSSGSYIITWYAESVCSAISSCSHQVIISDEKAPTPYCRSGITIGLTPPIDVNDEPFVEIWTSDIDLGSYDNCDQSVELSFDENNFSVSSYRFTCSDVGSNVVTMWVRDDMGNTDYCNTVINIQDNSGACPDTSGMMIAGHVETEFGEMIENAEVGLQTILDASMIYDHTNFKGEFAFHNLESYYDYQLEGISSDDYLNGVSTLDLIIMQRHILGLEELDSPYKLIAADVNNSQDVSAIDLLELRKLILGIYSELPQNNSWRYVDKSQKFIDTQNPWPIKENIQVYDLQDDMMSNDFVAVKVGDVNGNVTVNPGKTVDSRNRRDLDLVHDVLKLNDRNEYLVPFYFKSDENIMGIQLFLEYNPSQITILDIESGRLNVNEENYSVHDGALSLVWHNERALNSDAEDALFYILIEANGKLEADLFDLNSEGLKSEIYDHNLDVGNVRIERRQNNYQNRLYQNIPNPFNSMTTIDFELAKDQDVKIAIYDTNGRLVKLFEGSYQKGLNSIMLSYNELNGNGIYYYQLDTESFSATRKMILIE